MIEAVIFDWAGTTVDYGCFAPVKAFMEAFAHHGVPVTMEETRKPMGMLKRDHIRTMLHMERIAAEWKRVHGHEATEEAVDAVYAQFEPKLFSILDQYAAPKPFAVETAAKLREMGVKIGSTTGYTDSMMHIVAPTAARLGYAPDFWISPDRVGGRGRPDPYMIFENPEGAGGPQCEERREGGGHCLRHPGGGQRRRVVSGGHRGQLRPGSEPDRVRGPHSGGAQGCLPPGRGDLPRRWSPLCAERFVPAAGAHSDDRVITTQVHLN